jgi:hypothetical protein
MDGLVSVFVAIAATAGGNGTLESFMPNIQ